MLRNWRIWPLSSRTCRAKSGNCEVNWLKTSATVVPLQSTFGAPFVNRRNAVGISILTAMCLPPNFLSKCFLQFHYAQHAAPGGIKLASGVGGGRRKLRVEVRFECFNLGRDSFAQRE